MSLSPQTLSIITNGINNQIVSLIREEIQNDPFQLGYAGKSTAAITTLLNTSFDDNPTRINQLLTGIPFAPNAVTVTDIQGILE